MTISCSKKTEMNRQLIEAVIQGDGAKVNDLLTRGADVNALEEANPARSTLVV